MRYLKRKECCSRRPSDSGLNTDSCHNFHSTICPADFKLAASYSFFLNLSAALSHIYILPMYIHKSSHKMTMELENSYYLVALQHHRTTLNSRVSAHVGINRKWQSHKSYSTQLHIIIPNA